MPSPNSLFDLFWIDQANADSELGEKIANRTITPELGVHLANLIRDGYTIIPGAINHQLADQLLEEISAVTQHPDKFIARRNRAAYAHPTEEVAKDATFRLIDFHVNSRHASKAIYARPIADLLDAVFSEPANAFQCLTFNHGSQQRMHQDAAYVVVSEPLKFLASWIALEDVQPGSGELMYYAGSHKLEDFLFGEEKSKAWTPELHGQAIHREFLDSLERRSEAAGLPLQTFLPKKGDALIWASDLVHGGSQIQSSSTRKSIVTHYCPINARPKFSTFTDYFHLRQVAPRGYISSRHYDLRGRKSWFSAHYPLLAPKFMGQKS